MPETPDFDQILEPLIGKLSDEMDPDNAREFALRVMCQVWNARGAADIVQLETSLSSQMGSTAAGPYVKNLDRALRTLDR